MVYSLAYFSDRFFFDLVLWRLLWHVIQPKVGRSQGGGRGGGADVGAAGHGRQIQQHQPSSGHLRGLLAQQGRVEGGPFFAMQTLRWDVCAAKRHLRGRGRHPGRRGLF